MLREYSSTLLKQGSKPVGIVGNLIGRLMNIFHRPIYLWGLQNIHCASKATILDVGCGGGYMLKLLVKKAPAGKIYGLDHSPEMVKLATRVNNTLIKKGRVEIKQASVDSLPFIENMFDLVTAFETIQFWPVINENLKEIKRVLKPGGTLLVVNWHPKHNTQWLASMPLQTADDYKSSIQAAGFIDLHLDDQSRINWLLISAQKSFKI